MIEVFSNIATSLGLSASAGLNAYLPLLVVALMTRFFPNLITLNEPWDVLTSWWVIGTLVTGASGGTLNPVVSLAEDIASLAASLLAILVPILLLLLLLLAFLLGLLWYRRCKARASW
jgi:hypothetical protein